VTDSTSVGLTPAQFRDHFPAVHEWTWLDTPGSPPAAAPVAQALTTAVGNWLDGSFDWLDWDARPQQVRGLFARYTGVPEEGVALVGSVAEAAATVAASIPPGHVVVLEDEFRSNLFPWLAANRPDLTVIRAPLRPGLPRAESLAAAITAGTSLVAVSEVLSSDGERVDLHRVRSAADRVGARLFVDTSQTLGALATDLVGLHADYLACHGYKWLLCPRGAAWLVVRPDRVPELRPLATSWKSTRLPHGYFGGSPDLPDSAAKLDTSPAWLAWIGAAAALELLSQADREQVERHCLALAREFRDGLQEQGWKVAGHGEPSQIVAAYTTRPDAVAAAFRRAGVRATVSSDRFRVGFHYFNNEQDVATALAAVAAEREESS